MTKWEQITPHLRTTRPHDDVLVISLSNPPYNFLNRAIFDELKQVINSLDTQTTRGVVLTSHLDQVFVTHYSVQEIVDFGNKMPAWMPTPSWLIRTALQVESWSAVLGFRWLTRKTMFAGVADLNLYHEVTHLIRSKPQVFVAAINGLCYGGGCEFALACDYRVVIDTDSAIMGQLESLIGLIPGGGGTQFLSRALGTAKALELCLEGKSITPAEALELGLVNKVVAKNKLEAEAVELARHISRRSPFATQAIKDSVHTGSSLSFQQGLLREKTWFARAALVPESQQAMAKYIDHLNTAKPQTQEDFESIMLPFQQGLFHDFTPGSARRDAQAYATSKHD